MGVVDIDKAINRLAGEFSLGDVYTWLLCNENTYHDYSDITDRLDYLKSIGKIEERFNGMKFVYKNVSESALQQEMEMEEDNYQVNVTLSFDSSGHHDPLFPDTNGTLYFDATDCHIDAMLEQFTTFLRMIGYVIDSDQKLELVKAD